MTVFSLMLIYGCNGQHGRGAVSVSKTSLANAYPVITVSGSEIKINGTRVWLGDTLAKWKSAVGGTPVCHDAGLIATCVWHSDGLSLGTDHAVKTRVKFLLLDLAIHPPELGERAPSWPQSPFHGSLELDGIPIDADTIFRDLRRNVASSRMLDCGGSDCGSPSAPFSDSASIDLTLTGRSEKSSILRFSIDCLRTKACTALMPRQAEGKGDE